MPLAISSLFLLFLLPPGRRAAASIDKASIANGDPSIGETDPLLVPGENSVSEAPSTAHGHGRTRYADHYEYVDSILSGLHKAWGTAKKELRQFTQNFTRIPIVRFSYATMLVQALGKKQSHILLQYVSKRFGTTIAQVSFRTKYNYTYSTSILLFILIA
jgi:hypothetical protein